MPERNYHSLVWATLLFAASQAHLAHMLASLEPSIFAVQLAFLPETYWRIIDTWGSSGLAIYRAHFVFDTLHPLIYGAFGYLLVSRTNLFRQTPSLSYRALLYALPVAGAFDLAENAAQLYLLNTAPDLHSAIVPFSASCSLAKWLLAGLFALLVAGQILRRLSAWRP